MMKIEFEVIHSKLMKKYWFWCISQRSIREAEPLGDMYVYIRGLVIAV